MSVGGRETSRLRQNLESQMDRLLQQLADLEDCRQDMEDGEYADARADTVEQLEEFEASLTKMAQEGDNKCVCD